MKPRSANFVFDEDDITIGEIYSRRKALTVLAGAGSAVFFGACGGDSSVDLSALTATNELLPASCVVRPALTEGPIFVDEQANRSDIRTDTSNGATSKGAALALSFRVSTLADNACGVLEGAQIDLWHCDAFGIYSDTDFENMGTVGQKFLRGHQFTDANGVCAFTTIYPGWYDGRAVHLHFKVRTTDGNKFTSQLFFDPVLTDNVYKTAPYNTRGERTVRNSDDGIYEESGTTMLLNAQPVGDGYEAHFDITLDLT